MRSMRVAAPVSRPVRRVVGRRRRVARVREIKRDASPGGLGASQRRASEPAVVERDYCVNASVQFYAADLTPKGHNIRLSAHTFDPQLNAPHTSCATCLTTFLGVYFGLDTAGTTAFFTSVSTHNDDGTNPHHYQQQIVASLAIP